jgi:hypothetical protein
MVKFLKVLFILGFILSINSNIYSQENSINIQWSKGIKDYGHGIINLGKTNKYMLIQINNHKPDIALLSLTNFSPVKHIKAFTPRIKDQILTYEKSIVFNNRLIVIANDSTKQFVLKYNIPDFNLIEATEIGNIVPLMNTTDESQKAVFSIKNTIFPIEFIKTNEDKNLHILFCDASIDRKISYVQLSIDHKNKEKITKNSFDIYSERFEILQNIITNKGSLFTLYRGLNQEGEYFYFLYDGKKNKISPIEINIKVNHLRIAENKDLSISIVGIGRLEDRELFFEIVYDSENLFLGEVEYIEMSDRQKTSLLKSKVLIENLDDSYFSSNKNKFLMTNYSIDGIKQINDELKLVYGENYKLSNVKFKKINIIRHEARELYVCVFNNAGKIVFFRTYSKIQVFENTLDRAPSWGSYMFYETDSSYNFIYSGEEIMKESKIVDTKKPFKPTGKSSNIIHISITKDLVAEITNWPDYSKEGIYISPFISLDYENGNLIIGSENEYDVSKQIYKFGKYKRVNK